MKKIVWVAGVLAVFLLSGSVFSLTSPLAEKKESFLKPATVLSPQTHLLRNVPYINQRDRYPTGCEAVSAVMAMQYLGISISVDAFIDQYLPLGSPPTQEKDNRYGCNPWEAFPGNPYLDTGWGCYAPVIAGAMRKAVSPRCKVEELRDVPLDQLAHDYIDNGIPVIVWATIDMKPPKAAVSWTVRKSGETITWIAPMHCLLLTGYDETHYYFHDPWRTADCRYRKADCETAYRGMYAQAVVIRH